MHQRTPTIRSRANIIGLAVIIFGILTSGATANTGTVTYDRGTFWDTAYVLGGKTSSSFRFQSRRRPAARG